MHDPHEHQAIASSRRPYPLSLTPAPAHSGRPDTTRRSTSLHLGRPPRRRMTRRRSPSRRRAACGGGLRLGRADAFGDGDRSSVSEGRGSPARGSGTPKASDISIELGLVSFSRVSTSERRCRLGRHFPLIPRDSEVFPPHHPRPAARRECRGPLATSGPEPDSNRDAGLDNADTLPPVSDATLIRGSPTSAVPVLNESLAITRELIVLSCRRSARRDARPHNGSAHRG